MARYEKFQKAKVWLKGHFVMIKIMENDYLNRIKIYADPVWDPTLAKDSP